MLSITNKNTIVYISRDYITNNKLKYLNNIYRIYSLKGVLSVRKVYINNKYLIVLILYFKASLYVVFIYNY